jgi:hypothetical protein
MTAITTLNFFVSSIWSGGRNKINMVTEIRDRQPTEAATIFTLGFLKKN